MDLSIQDIGAIGEFISSIVVIITLVYLAVQIRQNTLEVRTTNRQQLLNRGHRATMQIAENPGLADVMSKAGTGEDLTRTERMQYALVVRGTLYDVQEAFLLFQENRLDQKYWVTRTSLIKVLMRDKAAKNVYRGTKANGMLHEDFVEWLDTYLEELSTDAGMDHG